jgi:hypothetical protein
LADQVSQPLTGAFVFGLEARFVCSDGLQPIFLLRQGANESLAKFLFARPVAE